MHGRIKVKTTAEQQEAKRKEREKKLQLMKAGISATFKKRNNEEYDKEALDITGQILQSNPDFYTLWNFRCEIILFMKESKNDEEFQKLCEDELLLTHNCLLKNYKSYRTWRQRIWIMDQMSHPSWDRELKLCDKFLEMDERNFHCWVHRKSIANKACADPNKELAFTMKKIEGNFSNYSAWHYRSKLLPVVYPDKSNNGIIEEEILLKEYDLVQNAAFTDPGDQSVWFYHRWLLGRAQKPANIEMFYVRKLPSMVIVQLSKPLLLSTVQEKLEISINGNPVKVNWKPQASALYSSTLWTSSLQEDLNLEQTFELIATLKCEEISSLNCTLSSQEAWTWKSNSRKEFFRSELSAATSDVLHQQLESCLQLYDLEPDNKWTLFNCVLLMRVLSSQGYEATIMKHMDQLISIDPLRKNYYKDLKSKFLIENVIERQTGSERKIILKDQNMTAAYHMDFLSLMQHVDLSSNYLTSTTKLCSLACVQTLILDNNLICSCEGLQELNQLTTLSMKKNKLSHLKQLEPLINCASLQHLCLEENHVTKEGEYLEYMKLKFSKLKTLDGIRL